MTLSRLSPSAERIRNSYCSLSLYRRGRPLALRLGPEFTTDQFTVETSDHAKLRLPRSQPTALALKPTEWYSLVRAQQSERGARLRQLVVAQATAIKPAGVQLALQ